MNRSKLVVIIIVAACAVVTLICFLHKGRKPISTRVGWSATVTNLAGDGSPGFRDGPQPTQSSFSDPFGLAVSADGSVYVADAGDNNRIRKLSREGPVTAVAGRVEGV